MLFDAEARQQRRDEKEEERDSLEKIRSAAVQVAQPVDAVGACSHLASAREPPNTRGPFDGIKKDETASGWRVHTISKRDSLSF